MVKQFTCDDGFVVRGEDESEVTDMAMTHMRNHHKDMKTTKEKVKEMWMDI